MQRLVDKNAGALRHGLPAEREPSSNAISVAASNRLFIVFISRSLVVPVSIAAIGQHFTRREFGGGHVRTRRFQRLRRTRQHDGAIWKECDRRRFAQTTDVVHRLGTSSTRVLRIHNRPRAVVSLDCEQVRRFFSRRSTIFEAWQNSLRYRSELSRGQGDMNEQRRSQGLTMRQRLDTSNGSAEKSQRRRVAEEFQQDMQRNNFGGGKVSAACSGRGFGNGETSANET